MALSSKEVVQDTPSEVVENLRKQFNLLLVAVDTSTDYASLKANVQTVIKILLSHTLPTAPSAPVTPVR